MTKYVVTSNTDITPSATTGFSLVKVDEEIQAKLSVAQRVFDALVEDGCYCNYVLDDDLWGEFKSLFTKAN